MVINFNGGGGVSRAEVQEMINQAVDFNTGVLNLSYATSGQVQEALADPERWVFSIDYSGNTNSGMTYLQHHVHQTSAATTVYFYVVGAQAAWKKLIYDRQLYARINKSTYEVTTGLSDYVPDIIYDLDQMNTEQLIVLAGRRNTPTADFQRSRFIARWTYNNRQYIQSVGLPFVTEFGIVGTCMAFENNIPKIYYDNIYIDSNGTITHYEYVSDATLTPVQ